MKFRGWDKNKKEFITNFCISSNGNTEIVRSSDKLAKIINEHYTSLGDDMWGDYAIIDYTDWYGINDVDVMRSTESLDKNQKEIFESDYVEFLDNYYLVKFERGCFLLEGKNQIWWHQLNKMDIESSMLIIGNIYEQRKTKLNILKNLI